MQGGGVLRNGEFELGNYYEEMRLFCKTTTTSDLSAQSLISWGPLETFSSQNIFITAKHSVHTLLNIESTGFLEVFNTVKKYLTEAPRFGFKSPGLALGTSQVSEAIGWCNPAEDPLNLRTQALINWGLLETFSSQNVFVIAEDDIRTLLKLESTGLSGVVKTPRFGFKNSGLALGTSQDLAEGPLDASPQTSGSSNQTSGSSASGSDSPFTIRSPKIEHWEGDGIVEDDETGDEVEVGVEENSSIELLLLNIPIIERMIDGTEHKLNEMNLINCEGYFSFAEKLRGQYGGNQVITGVTHVLWPWPGHSTTYMAQDDEELDPRTLSWATFSRMLRCILVRPQQDISVGLPINFQANDEVTECNIPREYITTFRFLVTTVHLLWAGWRHVEPLNPELITDLNMVGSLYSIHFLDAEGGELEIPYVLSVHPWEISDSGDEDGEISGDEEGEEYEDKDDGRVEDDNVEELDDDNAAEGEDGDNDELDGYGRVRNFMQQVTSIIVREREDK